MENINKILIVSRSTKNCRKAVHLGISLARFYKAKVHVLHVVHDPLHLEDWNLIVPSIHEEYLNMIETYKKELHRIIEEEKGQEDIDITEEVHDGPPVDEIMHVIQSEGIDLLVMLAHEEGRLEHFLFGRTNEAILRKMPCSILLVKK